MNNKSHNLNRHKGHIISDLWNLLSTMPVAALVASLDGIVEYANDPFLTLVQLPRNQVVNTNIINGIFTNLDAAELLNQEFEKLCVTSNGNSNLPVKVKGVRFQTKDKINWILYITPDTIHTDTDNLVVNSFAEKHTKIIRNHSQVETAFNHVFQILIENNDVELCLQEIGHLFNADRALVFQFYHNYKFMKNSFEWCSDSNQFQKHLLQSLPCDNFKWWMDKLKTGEQLVINDIANMPQKASVEREILQSFNNKAALVTPLRFDNELFGFLAISDMSNTRQWDIMDQSLLRILGDMLSLHFFRNQIGEMFQNTEKRYKDLIEKAFEIVIIFRNDQILFISQKGAETLGYKHANELIGKKVSQFIVPQDHEKMLEQYHMVVKNKVVPLQELAYKRLDGTQIIIEFASMYITYQEKPAVLTVMNNITRQKMTEKALVDSEKKYRTLVELSPDGIILTSIDGRVLMANQKMAELFGYNTVYDFKASDKKLFDYLVPDQLQASIENTQRLLKNGFKEKSRYNVIRIDNKEIVVETNSSLIRDDNKNPLYFIGVFRDISETIYFQNKIIESESRYKTLFDASPDGIVIVNKDGVISMISKPAANILGYENSDLLLKKKKNLTGFLIPSQRNVLLDLFSTTLNTTNPALKEFQFISRDKKRVFIEISISQYPPSDSRVEFVCFLRDVTAKKTIEKNLLKSEDKYRMLVESSPDSFFMCHLDTSIIMVNQKMAEILGYKSVKSLIESDKKLTDFLAPGYFNSSVENRNKLFNNEYDSKIKYEMLTVQKKKIVVEINPSIIKDEHGKPELLFGIMRDITDIYYAEQKLTLSEKRYKALFDQAPLGIVQVNINGKITMANFPAVQLLGYNDIQSFTQNRKKLLDYVHSTQRFAVIRDYKRVLKKQFMSGKEYLIKNKEGKLILVEVSISAIMNQYNNVAEFICYFRDVSMRKKTEQSLAESEKRYRTLAEAAQDIIFIIDKNDKIKYVNNYAATTLGYSVESLIGEKREKFFPMPARKRQKKSLMSVLQSGKALYTEHKSDMPDRNLWLGTRLVPLMNDNGEIDSVFGISRDISDRKKIEADLIESKKNYQLLVENQIDMIVKVDLEGRFLFVSPSYCQVFGKTEEELLGNYYMPLVHPDDLELTQLSMQQLFKPPYECRVEQRAFTKDGWRWISWYDKAVLENGKIVQIVGIGRDTTENKLIEEEIKSSKQRFQELAELLPEIVFEIDNSGNLTFINKSAFEVSGYTLSDFVHGVNVVDFVSPRDRVRVMTNIQKLVMGHEIFDSEYSIVHKNGTEIPVIIRSTPIMNNEKIIGLRGILINISKLKQTENALIQSENRFRSIIERSLDGYYFISAQGKLLYLNKQAEKILNVKLDNIKDYYLFEMFDKKFTDEIKRIFARVMSGKNVMRDEFEYKYQKGKSLWININARRVMEQGIVTGVEGFIKDITQQKRNEIEIKNNEARYRALFNNIPYEVFGLNSMGYFKEANNYFISRWGNVIQKKPETAIKNKKFADTILYSVNEINKISAPVVREYKIIETDKVIHYRLIMGPIILAGEQIIGYVGLNMDVTDKILAFEQSKTFSARLVQSLEDERSQISRDIHDSLGQILTALQFEISAAVSSMNKDKTAAERLLLGSTKTISLAIDEARNMCRVLRPPLIDDFGLKSALTDFVTEYSQKWNIKVDLLVEELEGLITKDAELTFFRVIQESLNNVLKYANATKVFIELVRENDRIVLTIADNGKGFDANRVTHEGKTSFGLLGMKERIEYLSGEFFVTSEISRGTQIKAIVPLNSLGNDDKD